MGVTHSLSTRSTAAFRLIFFFFLREEFNRSQGERIDYKIINKQAVCLVCYMVLAAARSVWPVICGFLCTKELFPLLVLFNVRLLQSNPIKTKHLETS